MDNGAISISLEATSPTAQWAAETARSLITGRLHLAHTGEADLYDGLIRTVAGEIFEGVLATPATNRAAERALSLAAALVHVSLQLADGWADADEVPHAEVVQSLFTLLQEEGVTF